MKLKTIQLIKLLVVWDLCIINFWVKEKIIWGRAKSSSTVLLLLLISFSNSASIEKFLTLSNNAILVEDFNKKNISQSF